MLLSESSYGVLFPHVLIWIHTFSHFKGKSYYFLYTTDCNSNLFWKEQGKDLERFRLSELNSELSGDKNKEVMWASETSSEKWEKSVVSI